MGASVGKAKDSLIKKKGSGVKLTKTTYRSQVRDGTRKVGVTRSNRRTKTRA
jgi:hypothetical protein